MGDFRIDTAEVRSWAKTPSGGILVNAYLTRSGIFNYRQPDGSIRRELRPPEEVFRADSLSSVEGAPLTRGHSTSRVDSINWRTHAIGHVSSSPVREGDFVAAKVMVLDASAIADVDSGKAGALSCGYTCDYVPTPGNAEHDGIQTNIIYNHVALLPPGRGRAGEEVRLRMDGFEDVDVPSYAGVMTPAEIAALQARVTELTGERDRALGERDAAVSRADAAEDPTRLDAAVTARALDVSRRTKAASVLSAKVDGSTREVCEKAIKVRMDSFDGAGRSDDYVYGVFDHLPDAKGARADGAGAFIAAAGTAVAASTEGKKSLSTVRNDAHERATVKVKGYQPAFVGSKK